MKRFDHLYARHKKLLELQKDPPPEFINQVRSYIKDVGMSGRDIYDLQERDQLRAYLNYWTTYAYQLDNSKDSQLVKLSEYLGKPVPTINWLKILIVILSLLTVATLVLSQSQQFSPRPTITPIVVASTVEKTNLAPVTTDTPSSVMQATPIRLEKTPTEIIIPAGPIVTLTDPANGQTITPLINFQGRYENLRKGWSIHILLQSISQKGRYFPITPYYVVENDKSGNWIISANLTNSVDIQLPDEYVVTLILVTSDQLRLELEQVTIEGIDTIPTEVIVFENQRTYLSRKAYQKLTGPYIAYMSTNTENKNADLFLVKEDGSGKIQITNTTNLNETYPCISPDGKRIVYIGQQRLNSGKMVYSLNTINIADSVVDSLIREENITYEHPRWSPDGRYIAFSKKPIDESKETFWNLFLYDFQGEGENRITQLTEGSPSDRYPTWMPDSKTLLFVSGTRKTSTEGIISLDIEHPKEMKIVLDSELNEVEPAVSPDGKMISYVGFATAEGFHDIFMFDLDGQKTSRIIETDGFEQDPEWSPDSSRIYYVGYYLDYGINIWSADVYGRDRKIITKDSSNFNPYPGMINTFFPIDTDH